MPTVPAKTPPPGMTGATDPSGPAEIVIVSVALPVPKALEAPSTTAVVPAVVGVPVITPVGATMVKPGGSGLAV